MGQIAPLFKVSDTVALQKNLPEAGHSTRERGRGRGRTRELAQALAARLSSVSALAALELGGVGGSIVRVCVG